MKIEKQVCNLKLAKKLKKLGVKQESLWYWVNEKLTFEQPSKEFKIASTSWYSAFTVAELGEKLPYYLGEIEVGLPHKSSFDGGKTIEWGWGWQEYLVNRKDGKTIKTGFAKTEANARAKMIIYLRENKLLD